MPSRTRPTAFALAALVLGSILAEGQSQDTSRANIIWTFEAGG